MRISARTPRGQLVSLDDVDPSTTVAELKASIRSATGFPPPDQTLAFRGRVLDDSDSCSTHKIRDGHVLSLFVRHGQGEGGSLHIDRMPAPPGAEEEEERCGDGRYGRGRRFPYVRVRLRTMTNTKYLHLTARPDTTVDELKTFHRDKEGHPPECISLLYLGTTMCSGFVLSDYGIRDGDTIDVLLRVHGEAHGCGPDRVKRRRIERAVGTLFNFGPDPGGPRTPLHLKLLPWALQYQKNMARGLDGMYCIIRENHDKLIHNDPPPPPPPSTWNEPFCFHRTASF